MNKVLMKNILDLSFLVVLIMLSFNCKAQNLAFSYSVFDNKDGTSKVTFFVENTSGTPEEISALTIDFHYDALEASFSSVETSGLTALGWTVFAKSPTPQSLSSSYCPSSQTKIQYNPIDSDNMGAVISQTQGSLEILSFTFDYGSDGSATEGGVACLSSTADESAIVYNGTDNVSHPIVVAGLQQQALPVDYTFFSAQKEDKTSFLSWETASEINNDFFDVERSMDGRIFEKIGRVKGHGTTTETQNYDFIDREPLAGLNYYRLKQVDYNGDYEYSKVETVDFRNGTEGDVKIFPNPALDYANISLDRSYDAVRVTNQLGQLVEVLPASQHDGNQFKLDLTSYAPGVYFLEAKLGLEIVHKQFVKIK